MVKFISNSDFRWISFITVPSVGPHLQQQLDEHVEFDMAATAAAGAASYAGAAKDSSAAPTLPAGGVPGVLMIGTGEYTTG